MAEKATGGRTINPTALKRMEKESGQPIDQVLFDIAPGLPVPDSVDRHAVGVELWELYTQYGELPNDLIWKAAENPESAMHGLFEWDQRKAAERYWKKAASDLARCIRVEITFKDPAYKPVSTYAFATVTRANFVPDREIEVDVSEFTTSKNKPVRHRISLPRALSVEPMKKDVLADALTDLKELRARYAHLKELQPILSAIDRFLVKLSQKRKRK